MLPSLAWGQLYTQNFDTSSWTSTLCDVDSGNGGACEHVTEGCYSGGCARITLPTTLIDKGGMWQGGNCGLSGITFTATGHLNVRFLVKFSANYDNATNAGQNKLLVATGTGERPMIIMETQTYFYTTKYYTFSATEDNDTTFECGGNGCCGEDKWPHTTCSYYYDNPDGEDAFKSYNYEDQWISVELEYDTTANTSKVYLTTLDGAFNGLYVTRSLERSSGATYNAIENLGGYHSSVYNSNTYVYFDNIVVSNSYIGPPDGFVGGSATRKLNNVTGVRVTLH